MRGRSEKKDPQCIDQAYGLDYMENHNFSKRILDLDIFHEFYTKTLFFTKGAEMYLVNWEFSEFFLRPEAWYRSH